MANEPSKDPSEALKPQRIPIAKMHPLPGYPTAKLADRMYGALVSSIQANGLKEPLIVRQREDGEYQIVHGYRRHRACQLAKVKEAPVLVYDMTEQEALDWNNARAFKPDTPIPGKPMEGAVKEGEAAEKKAAEAISAAPGKGAGAPEVPKPSGDVVAAASEKENKPSEVKASGSARVVDSPIEGPTDAKNEDAAQKEEGRKSAKDQKSSGASTPVASTATEKEKPVAESAAKVAGKGTEKKEAAAAPAGPAASGPSGTAITQVFDPRLNPPNEKELKELPVPKAGESYFITLHPAYLEKSKFNNFSVDRESENFKELYKAIELAGVKDPVLARPKEGGGLEILSGQRRHMVASELNYPVPAIIQQIDDDDAKILVADSNLHRDKITSYDLSRALRMKMDGMKRKAGRRRKGDPTAPQLNSDEALAKEMGMSVSKLNKILRLSEATKEVCSRYDEGSMELSIAYALSFLKPKNQDLVMSLADLGYKLSTKRVERMKPMEQGGKLTEKAMREILEDRDLEPKTQLNPPTVANVPSTPASPPTSGEAPLPPSPDVPPVPAEPSAPTESGPTDTVQPESGDIMKGKQERPEQTKVILTGDRLRKYFPDVSMTPREIEESVYEALEERRQRQEKMKAKNELLKSGKSAPSR